MNKKLQQSTVLFRYAAMLFAVIFALAGALSSMLQFSAECCEDYGLNAIDFGMLPMHCLKGLPGIIDQESLLPQQDGNREEWDI